MYMCVYVCVCVCVCPNLQCALVLLGGEGGSLLCVHRHLYHNNGVMFLYMGVIGMQILYRHVYM